jgi:hypothetical protein
MLAYCRMDQDLFREKDGSHGDAGVAIGHECGTKKSPKANPILWIALKI